MRDLSYPKGIEQISGDANLTNDAVSYVRFDLFDRIDAKQYQRHRSINLYMPETLENPTNVSWEGQSLGSGGATGGGMMDAGNATLNWLNHSYESLTKSMSAKAFGGSQASGQDILANKEQKIVNPYMKMLFRGVNFRNFEMVFRFTPHSVDESKEIYTICQAFRAAALPEEEEGGYKWKYPREIEIKYKYQGRDHPWLNKFKRCVITDAHVNYTSAGHYVSMRNGFPAETELRLQFTEIELLTRQDLEGKPGESNTVFDRSTGEYHGPSF